MCPNFQRNLLPPPSSLTCGPCSVKRGQFNVAQSGNLHLFAEQERYGPQLLLAAMWYRNRAAAVACRSEYVLSNGAVTGELVTMWNQAIVAYLTHTVMLLFFSHGRNEQWQVNDQDSRFLGRYCNWRPPYCLSEGLPSEPALSVRW